ncbi:hypothetical protein AB4175_24195, partial [Vibrio cyclitrophicus]
AYCQYKKVSHHTDAREGQFVKLNLLHRETHRHLMENGPTNSPLLTQWQTAIARLPLRYREPLLLQSVLSIDNTVMATLLSIDEETLKERLLRGHSVLRKLDDRESAYLDLWPFTEKPHFNQAKFHYVT